MATSDFAKPWHGIPHTEIAWFPTVHEDKCIGRELCHISCGRGVFECRANVKSAITTRFDH